MSAVLASVENQKYAPTSHTVVVSISLILTRPENCPYLRSLLSRPYTAPH